MPEFTDIQRERIIRDIINHKVEVREACDPMTTDEVRAERTRLRTLSDWNLKNMWEGRIGEWLCSIGREYPSLYEAWENADRHEYDNPADWQFDKLLDNGDVDYEYQVYAYETPYTDVELPSGNPPCEIVNYPDIRESLELILEMSAPSKKEEVLESLDDALANNSDRLTVTEENTC